MKIPRGLGQDGEPLKYEIAAMRLSMARRIVPEDEFRRLYALGIPRAEMARRFEVEEHDIHGLEEYYQLPPRPNGGARPAVDRLADRVWQILEPRIEAKIKSLLGG